MTRDQARVDAVEGALKDEGLDVLACALPANVLLLTGYWPVVGTSLALAARGGPTILLAPQDEEDLARQGWADEVHTFEPGSLADLRDAEGAVRGPLAGAARRLGAGRGRVGYERGGSFEPCSYAS